jgi:hypothetical protein
MKIIILILITLNSVIYSQQDNNLVNCPFDEKNRINYTAVVDCYGQSRKEIYDKLKNHILLKFLPPTINDSNQIAGKSTLVSYYNGDARDVEFIYFIFIKDGKFKYELTNFTLLMVNNATIQSGLFGSLNISEKQINRYPVEEKYIKSYRKYKKDMRSINFAHEVKYGFFEGIQTECSNIVEGLEKVVNKSNW